jgi:hypothetical protein
MKLNIKTDCANSPKSELVKNLTIYFASYNLDQVKNYLEDNVTWSLVGDTPIIGKEQFIKALEKMSHNKVAELTIHSIVTHGKVAATHGDMLMEDGNNFGFSDFYEFTNAKANKVKSIVSYVVKK